MNVSSALPSTPAPTPQPLSLRERLQLVPPARIIAAVEDSGSILTLGDLRQYAKLLAEEFGYDPVHASVNAPFWYTEQIEHCTLEQGRQLRTMTIELCGEVALLLAYQREQSAMPLPLTKMTQAGQALDAFEMAVVMVALFLLLPFLWSGPDDLVDDFAGATHSQTQTAPAATQAVSR